MFCSSFRQGVFAYLHQASKSLRQLLRENFKVALSLSEDALEHIEELPCKISKLELPGIGEKVKFVLLSGDRLFSAADYTLYVYQLSDLTLPKATYILPIDFLSALIADNNLFIGSSGQIIVYEISASLTQPLKQLAIIKASRRITKMIKVGQELILGESPGYLEVFDIEKMKITHTKRF